MTDRKPTLYVIAGHDGNGALKDFVAALEQRGREKGDVVILRPEPGESAASIGKRIKPPANVLVAAHGGENGGFEWYRNELVPYGALFASLPRQGVESVTVAGCYGVMAQNETDSLPLGTLLQSMVGRVVNYKNSLDRMSLELTELPQVGRLNIMLKALDNADPEVSIKIAAHNRSVLEAMQRPVGPEYTYRAADVLPHTIAIGGRPPIELDLDVEIGNLGGRGRAGGKLQRDFQHAVALVKAHFDTDAGIGDGNEMTLLHQINGVVNKLGRNAPPEDYSLAEKRIAYAIALANLEVSGEMGTLIAQAKASAHGNAPARTSVTTQWDGKGSETVARLQAILEAGNMSADNGGARDGKVSGQMNGQTRFAIEQMQKIAGITDDPKHEKLLAAIVKDPSMTQLFATVKDANGQEVVNVTLTRPGTGAAQKSSAER